MTTPAYKRKQEKHVDDDGVVVQEDHEIQLSQTFSVEGFKSKTPKKKAEGFAPLRRPAGIVGIEATLPYNDAAPYSGPSLPDFTPPAAKNLFMNVLLDEYKYNPDRPPAAPVTDPIVKQAFDDYFRVQWFSDPTDVFGKTQSQRMFLTQPITSIPNDQKSYQDWLYKIPGKTCKEGNGDACYGGTNGSAMPWLNM